MGWIGAVALIVLLLGTFTVFFGPPYLPTLERQKHTALDLLNLKPGQTLLELGSGDGRVLLAAAERGITVIGIELSPLLAFISWVRTRRYRRHVRIICANYFGRSWPPADALFTFMIDRQMGRLDDRIEAWRDGKPVQLASIAFRIPDKQPTKEKDGVFLYVYK